MAVTVRNPGAVLIVLFIGLLAVLGTIYDDVDNLWLAVGFVIGVGLLVVAAVLASRSR